MLRFAYVAMTDFPESDLARTHSRAMKSTTASAACSRFCFQVRPDCLRGLKL
jgi:hypothetical protein